MPETTDTLRWTELRHRMLRRLASGDALNRTFYQAELPGTHNGCLVINDTGLALLSRWDAEHPERGDHAASDH